MLATSLGQVDVPLGEIVWWLAQSGLYSAAFVVVMLGLGLISSWRALLAVPAALVIAFAFTAVGMAVTSYLKTFQQMEWVNTALLLHLLCFAVMIAVGVTVASRRLERLLLR